ncbi:hypothetical protein ACIBI3_30470 [Actinomadura luteofluorescens]|uniref:hypothetical protein n=1 Tax=Actinomadura luteofluorescens TaxID=46163 RepID=UPI00349B8FA1
MTHVTLEVRCPESELLGTVTYGYQPPKPFKATSTEIAEVEAFGVTENEYRCARGAGASHPEVIAFLKDHASCEGELGQYLYDWAGALGAGATVAQLRAHRELQEEAGVPLDYERHFLAMTDHVPFGAREYQTDGRCVPSICGE